MAKFRKVHTSFWDDPLMEKINPDARYFYLFLITNPLCTECGIYQITLKKMCNYTGYNEDSIKSLIRVFEVENSRIVYDTSTEEICLLKKPNYIENTGKPVVDCLNAEFLNVKNKNLIVRQLLHIEREAVRKIYDSWYATYDVPSNKVEQEKEEKKKRREKEDEEATSTKKMEEKEFLEFKQKLQNDKIFTTPLMMARNISNDTELSDWINRFNIHISGEGKINKDYSEYRKHFKNWILKQDTFTKKANNESGKKMVL